MTAILRAPELSATSRIDRICILSLTTTPTFSDFWLIALPGPFLAHHGLDAREFAAHGPDLLRVLEVAHRFLDPHPKQLVGELAFADAELVGAEVADFGGLHS